MYKEAKEKTRSNFYLAGKDSAAPLNVPREREFMTLAGAESARLRAKRGEEAAPGLSDR